MEKLDELLVIIKESKNIVFFGGAGVSVASGIPDFRGVNGIYTKHPEEIVSHHYFVENTEDFYDFYFKHMVFKDAMPNECHKALAYLEQKGILKAVVTQNIDGLHQRAGSKNVLELHGTIWKNHCVRCHKFYSLDDIKTTGVPHCSCGGIIKPDVVLYEEGLDETVIRNAVSAIANADTLIIAGTSLVVYPAAGFIRYFQGKNLVYINLGAKSGFSFCRNNLIIDGKVEDYLNIDNLRKGLE